MNLQKAKNIVKKAIKILIAINILMLLMIFYSLNFIVFSIYSILVSFLLVILMWVTLKMLDGLKNNNKQSFRDVAYCINFFVFTVGKDILVDFNVIKKGILNYIIMFILFLLANLLIDKFIKIDKE